MTLVAFTVHGVPAPQGSKTRTPQGGMRESSRKVEPWRNAVAAAGAAAMHERELLVGAVALDVVFVFPRPRSHFGTGRNAGQLKPSAPIYCSTQPDLDKLVRAVGDAMSGIVFRDDALVVELRARKHYGSPRADVAVVSVVA